MIDNVKALVAVLAIATIAFAFARRAALPFVAPADLRRRIGCWYGLTTVGFLSPNFWLYVLVAAPVIAWAARKDSNPLGLYAVLLFVIPPLPIQIPTGGLLNLFYVDNGRLLGLVLLLPLAVGALGEKGDVRGLRGPDRFLLLFGVLQLVLLFPYESFTNTMRRAVLFMLDVYLIYYAFSRGLRTKRQIDDTFASFCLVSIVMAAFAVFESVRQWLLYTPIGNAWGASNEFAWLFRGDRLRAQASTGHALSLGYMLAIALGMWLYLKAEAPSRVLRVGVTAILCVGIYFTFSRGPMLTAAFLALTYTVLSQASLKRAMISIVALSACVTLFLWSPLGANVTEALPFVGSQDQGTVTYRQQLATVSWELIQRNPFFGDPFVMLNMESLRQGQGIIDLVNAFASVALFYGLTGLVLFVAAFLSGMKITYDRFRWCNAEVAEQAPFRSLGAVMLAAMMATLLFMGTAGNAWLQWQLLGLLTAYGALAPVVASRAGSPASTLLDRNGVTAT